jgi:mitogen-activated protein kinase 1/3
LAELLSMQDGNVPSYQDRKPIFPGGFCYPLSGEGDRIKKDDRLDQLNMIFKVIGTPSQDDVDSVGKASEYVKSLGEREGVPLEKLYPVADPQALDLLRLMLQFNPAKRLTASEALEHNFFKGIRRQEFERVADGPLTGPDFLETQRVDLRVLKQKTLEEVLWFRDQGGTKR